MEGRLFSKSRISYTFEPVWRGYYFYPFFSFTIFLLDHSSSVSISFQDLLYNVKSVCSYTLKNQLLIFSRMHATLQPALSVGRLVRRSHFTFFMILFLLPHCSCPNGLVTSNMAPAHPVSGFVFVHSRKIYIYIITIYSQDFSGFIKLHEHFFD